jgi:hypothetical protein
MRLWNVVSLVCETMSCERLGGQDYGRPKRASDVGVDEDVAGLEIHSGADHAGGVLGAGSGWNHQIQKKKDLVDNTTLDISLNSGICDKFSHIMGLQRSL